MKFALNKLILLLLISFAHLNNSKRVFTKEELIQYNGEDVNCVLNQFTHFIQIILINVQKIAKFTNLFIY